MVKAISYSSSCHIKSMTEYAKKCSVICEVDFPFYLTPVHACVHTHTHTHTHTLQSLGASPGAKPPTCHGTVSAAGSAARGRWSGAFWAARTAGWGAGPGSPAPPRCGCWSCLTTPSCAVPQSPWPVWGKGWWAWNSHRQVGAKSTVLTMHFRFPLTALLGQSVDTYRTCKNMH